MNGTTDARSNKIRLLCATIAGWALFAVPEVQVRAAGPEANLEILEASVDPAFPATYNQELKLRVRVINRGTVPAQGAALEARTGAARTGGATLGAMGGGEQRTLTFPTGFKPGCAESCVSIVPVVAPSSPVKAGPGRVLCLTPGSYSVSERPGS